MKTKSTNFDGCWDDVCQFCGEKQEAHKETTEYEETIDEHRMPCEPEKAVIIKGYQARAKRVKILAFVIWLLVPFIITVAGFASKIFGVILFVYSIIKLFWTSIELFGKPEKWFPQYATKISKKTRMEHYYYHCERNPEGFQRLVVENFEREES